MATVISFSLFYIYIYIYIYIIKILFLILMGFGFCTWELQLFIIKKYILFTHYLPMAYWHVAFSSSWLVECRCQHRAVSYSLKFQQIKKLYPYQKQRFKIDLSLYTLESLFNYSFTLTTLVYLLYVYSKIFFL